MTNSSRQKVARRWWAVLAAAVLLIALAPAADAAERNATSSRSGSVSRSDVATKTSGSSSAPRSSPTASATRSGGRSGGTATRSPGSGRPSHRPSHYNRSYYHYSHWGAYFGFYPWGFDRYWYPYSYYPLSPMLYYGPHPGDYRDHELGALDLNVKPKKTEVWVDGQLIGASGKFDGFPGYLWLERGRHQLVFHSPGMVTEVREVRVLRGTVVKVNLRLAEGETVPPESLVKEAYSRRGKRPGRRAEAQAPRAPREVAEEAPPRMEKKVTIEPGRLVLSIEPGDASVYLDSRFLGTAEELSRLHAGLLVNPGPHTLEVVRPGFNAERIELDIEADTETSLSVELESG